MDIKKHWETIYSRKAPQNLAWYTPHLETSLSWINDLAVPKDAHIIDAGCGVSTLLDDLVAQGYTSVSGLDLSEKALSIVQERTAAGGAPISWLRGDITAVDLATQHYVLWHDRAAFHFLVDAEQQAQYIRQLSSALRPGGHVILGVFSSTAPPVCSGLRVQRYTAKSLSAALGADFDLIKQKKEVHTTPGGVQQVYQYCLFRKHGG